ncbi:MAG TPA: exodeoxyribonuclease VII large subunit [Xanthobacteraceae bacterium]|jgi:exodeoxyribonuclease VII large subunit|nr:exodeoxyribonuclease VII large subunit [Xanthobacteraceae bacterium]
MTDTPRINVVELTVSELSNALKRAIEDGFGYVRVRGELGNVKYHSSGHVYLDLKDEKACLAGVIWRLTAQRIKLKLEAGLEVVVTGRITTFPGQSKYQIVIETLEPAGVGALMALLEERKKKFAAEGLFDAARKQLLPFLPKVIGVITSPTGAVIRDILHRLSDRFPRQVLVWPVKVQGEGSAEQVAAAINGFNAFPFGHIAHPDVIIVARGGGSLEDLWSFNEEIVVRAAAASMIPLISAVGHETDITLIDFVSDKRAPTPTAAAEMAVPVRADLITRISALHNRQVACWQRGIENRRKELRSLARALPGLEDLFALPRQRLDTVTERFPLALRVMSARRHDRLVGLSARLGASLRANTQAHRTHIAHDRQRLAVLQGRARVALDNLLDRRDARLERAGQLLAAFSYRGVLARGFTLVRGSEGQPLRNAAAITPGQRLDIEFTDGRVGALAEGSRPIEQAPPIRRRRRTVVDPGQGSLF